MTKIVFMGTPDFSVPVLRRLVDEGYDVIGVVTQPDRPVGRKRVLTPPPVKSEALKHGIPPFLLIGIIWIYRRSPCPHFTAVWGVFFL